MQCLDQNQTVKGKTTIFWCKPNSTKIILEIWMQINYGCRIRCLKLGDDESVSGTRSQFCLWVCRYATAYMEVWRQLCGVGSLFPPLCGSQVLNSGCQGTRLARQAPSPREPPPQPNFHYTGNNPSLWGLHSPRYTSNFTKLWTRRTHF